MNASIPLDGAHIVAAATPARSKSPFNQGRPIVRAADGRLMRARTYDAHGDACGPLLSDDDLQTLIAAGQALPLERPVPAAPGLVVWVLRAGFVDRELALHRLRAGRWVHALQPGPEHAWVCVVDARDAALQSVRDDWQTTATEKALDAGREGRWKTAEQWAEQAYALSPGLAPEPLALLLITHERTGRAARARGLRAMAERSRGAAFAERLDESVAQLRAQLRSSLDEHPPAQSQTLDRLRAALAARGRPLDRRSARLVEYAA